ncbi:MAG TPA: bifunctional DNA primase/polymerase [Pseudolabrys sp.]|nr:bifunctional DNA primase/polymerase [Pseudolabrys sp.]
MTASTTTNNARVAADLAAAGFSVFPCHSGGADVKKPMPGVFWRSASTNDRVKVEKWWRRWPDAAVGLDLAKSGLVVIDADRHGDDDGVAAVATLMHEHGFDPDQCPLVSTPNAGTHYYFRQPGGEPLGNGRGSLPAGIDVRGAGGYVIAPGTMLGDGRQYEAFGMLNEAPELPDWLRAIIADRAMPPARPIPTTARPSDERIAAYLDKALQEELDAVRYAPRGQRNNQLNTSSFSLGQMVAAGWIGEAEVSAMLENAAAELARDDGTPAVRKTIRSGLRSGMRQPREMPDAGYDVTEVDYAASDRLRASFDRRAEAKAAGANPETGEFVDDVGITDATAVNQLDMPDDHLHPPGLVGEVADWICDWTAEPIRIHAVGAALVILGTLLGRKVYSRTRPTSTALYIGAIAPSGMGKQHPQDAIRLALQEVTGGSMQYSGWAVSLPKMVVDLQSNAAKVMVADEFADKLIGIRSKNASTSQMAISEGLRSLWGTNTGTYSPDVSLSRGDGNIMRPCLSFYGASTIKDFARSLVSKDVTNGLFNRFLILPRFGDVTPAPERDGVMTLPPALKDRLSWLNQCLPSMQLTMAARGDGYPQPILVPMTDDAEDSNEANKAFQAQQMRLSDEDDALMLWGRFAEQCKRVALIVACGRCPEDVCHAQIDANDMAFATTFVRYSIDQFVGIVRRDMVESWVQAQHKLVLGIVRTAGTISRNDLVRKVDGRIQRKPLAEIIASLVEGQNIEALAVDPGPRGGRPKEVFRWVQD